MLLIVEHGRREGERAAYAHVGKRDHDRALGVLGLDVAHDSADITEVRDFRDGLDGLDGHRVLLSREMHDQVGHQDDLERHRRIKDVDEFASLLWLIEHRRHPFDIERDDSIIADDREYGSIEPFSMRRTIAVSRPLRDSLSREASSHSILHLSRLRRVQFNRREFSDECTGIQLPKPLRSKATR
jgi:hypothetical protein